MKKKTQISIDPEKEGAFTAFAKRLGMGVQEAAQHVLANRDQYSAARVKQANFARNASKWKKQDGGVVGMPVMQMGGDPEQMKAALVARYGSDWEKKASPDELKQYYNTQGQVHQAFFGKIADEYQKFQEAQATEKQRRKEEEKYKGFRVQRDAESIKKSQEQLQRAENWPNLESVSQQMKAGLAARYGTDWERAAPPREVQQYYNISAAENQEKERQKELLPYLKGRGYLDNAQKRNDSLLENGFHPWDAYQNAKYSTDLVQYMGDKHPELVEKELGRAKLLGKTMLLSGKYLFPEAAPAFDWVNNGVDAVEFAQNPNDTMNQAQIAADLLSPLKSRRLKIKPFGVVGDILDAVEIANDANKYARGGISTQGYKANSPDRFNSFNIIPSNQITMQGVPHPVMGADNLGNQQLMLPGAYYQFPGQAVFEVPIRRHMQMGGGASPVPLPISPYPKTDTMITGTEPSLVSKRMIEPYIQKMNSIGDDPNAQAVLRDNYFSVPLQQRWMKSYVDSDRYRDLLQREGFSEQEAIDEQKARSANLNNLDFSYSESFPNKDGSKSGTLASYYARKGSGEAFKTASNSWKPIVGTGEDRPRINFLEHFRPGHGMGIMSMRTVPVHEDSHVVDDGGARIPLSTMQNIFDNTKQLGPASRRYGNMVFGYTNTPTEFIGRLQAVRYLMDQHKIYNPQGAQEFNEQDYERMRQHPLLQGDINYRQLMQTLKGNEDEKKQRFIHLMNTIASNNSDSEGSTVAKYGGAVGEKGLLPKMAGGGGYRGSSIVDYLNSVGVDASKANRKQLATQWGVKDYTGTAAQNLALLEALRSGQGPARGNNGQDTVPSEPVPDTPLVANHSGPDPRKVHPKNGYVNLADYGVKLYNDDGYTYSPEAIQFAIDVQKAQADQKVKFVCNQKGCFAIANRASEGLTGKRLTGPGAWQTSGTTVWESPAMQAYGVGSGKPLPNPKEADYNIPSFMNQLNNVFVKLDRTNNRVNGVAQTPQAADDSYDYANADFFPESTGNEHIGYIPQPGWLLHGAAKGANHPAFFVLENLLKNKNISLPGYGRYAPVAVVSPNRRAAPIETGDNKGSFLTSLTDMLGFAQGGEAGVQRALKIPRHYQDGGTQQQANPDLLYSGPELNAGDEVRYSLRENKKDSKAQREAKQKLVEYFNNADLDDRLMAATGMTKRDLQRLKPDLFGMMGNESKFNDMSWQRALKEFVTDPFPTASVGPFQVKYESVPQKVRDQFGISGRSDLHDLEKAYTAGLSVLYGGKPLTDSAIAKGKQPGLEDADDFKYTYAYNMPAMVRGGDGRIKQLWDADFQNDANKRVAYREGQLDNALTEADKEAYYDKRRLRMDKGSYAYKAKQNAYDLITTKLTPEELNALAAEAAAKNQVRGPLLAASGQVPAYVASPFGSAFGDAPVQVQPKAAGRPAGSAVIARATPAGAPWPLANAGLINGQLPFSQATSLQTGGTVEGTQAQKDWLESYLQSPKYLQRLQQEFGQPDVASEQEARLQNLRNVPLKYSRDLGSWMQGAYMPKEYKGLQFKKGWQPAAPEPDPIYGIEKPGTLYLGQQYRPGQVPLEKFATTPVHEYSHVLDDGGFRIPNKTIDKIYDYTNKQDDDRSQLNGHTFGYLNEPTEVVGRLQAVRYLLNKNKIYDAGTQDFDDAAYEKMLNDPAIQGNSDYQELLQTLKGNDGEKKKRFMDLMNTVASRSKPADTTTARFGGAVSKRSRKPDPANMYMQVGGGVNGSGLYPYGVINPFDIDPNQDNGPFGNPIAPGPASATPAAPPAAPAFADSGLYPYGVTNPFDMDPYELQRRNAGQNKPTPPSVTPPVSSIADKLKLPAINTDPVASMAKASALDAKAKLVASFNIKPKTQTTWGSNIGAANALIGGMSIFSSIAEAANNNRTANQNRFRNWGDAIGPMVSANRGSYTTNEGFLFPNQKTPVQFAARPAIAQMGGGYYSEPTNLEPIPMGPLPEIPSAPPVDMAPPANNSHAGMDDHSNFKMPNVTVNQRVKPNEAAWQAYDYYVNEKGLEPHVAAGIIGNLYQESGLKPQVKERARPELEQQGYTAQGMGIAQWSANGRYKTLLAYADKNKRDPNDLYTQLDFILDEPGEGAKALKALAKTSTPEEASYVFGKIYERPMDKYAGWDVRAGIARKLFEGNLPNKNDVAKQDHSPAAHQGNYQQGGEYIVSPKQLEFILANGGEVEYL